jgi:hypothetical protein
MQRFALLVVSIVLSITTAANSKARAADRAPSNRPPLVAVESRVGDVLSDDVSDTYVTKTPVATSELSNIVEGKPKLPAGQPRLPPEHGGPGGPKEGGGPDHDAGPKESEESQRRAPLPDAVKAVYESRRGFTNHHFNTVERDRVARLIAADRLAAPEGSRWVLAGRLATGQAFRIELSDTEGMIDLPTGTTRVDATGELDVNPSPPGSGGMLAALLLWRRLLREGPEPIGRTSYWGMVPLDPRSFGETDGPRLVDMLESSVAGVEAHFTVADDGFVTSIDLWTAPDADPCEVRFTSARPDRGQEELQNLPKGMPAVIEVRHGNELFGEFLVEQAVLEAAGNDAGGDTPEPKPQALPGGGT